MRSSFVLGMPFSSIARATAGVLLAATIGNTPFSLCGSTLIELIIGVLFDSLDRHFQRLRIGAVEADRRVDHRLDIFDQPNEIVRFALRGRACIGIEPVGAGVCLFFGQILDEGRIAFLQ